MNLLIVDDDPFILKMISLTLQKSFDDVKIKSTSNGEEALYLITSKEYVPDVVLMDYMMPGLDGLETSKKIKEWSDEQDTFIYILMVTAKTQKNAKIASLEVVDDFISKPMDIDLLVSRINAAIRIIKLFKEKNKLLNSNQQLYEHLLEINHINEKLVNRLSEVIEQMAISLSEAIEYKDPITGTHVLKVGYIAETLAKTYGADSQTIELAKYAGFFHDIGKIGIPDCILQKPGRLTDEEFDKIKEHPGIGAEIIKPMNFFHGIDQGIRHHHERWDGTGYPDHLKGDEIPLIARFVSVADVFDVIIAKRPYKEQRTMKEAFEEIMKNSGTQFDPTVCDLLEKLYKSGEVQKIYEEIEKQSETNPSQVALILRDVND